MRMFLPMLIAIAGAGCSSQDSREPAAHTAEARIAAARDRARALEAHAARLEAEVARLTGEVPAATPAPPSAKSTAPAKLTASTWMQAVPQPARSAIRTPPRQVAAAMPARTREQAPKQLSEPSEAGALQRRIAPSGILPDSGDAPRLDYNSMP